MSLYILDIAFCTLLGSTFNTLVCHVTLSYHQFLLFNLVSRESLVQIVYKKTSPANEIHCEEEMASGSSGEGVMAEGACRDRH